MGLHPWEFYEYTVKEFQLRLQGYHRRGLEEWQRTRALAFTMASPYLKNRNTRIEDWWPLPGEEGRKVKGRLADLSIEDRKKRWEELQERYKKVGLN